ncbi:hypothetical protein EBU94_07270, partial [bacterium]|nr:hypothetical protein [bacterium]
MTEPEIITMPFDDLMKLIDLRARDIVQKEILRLGLITRPMFQYRNYVNTLAEDELSEFMLSLRVKKVNLLSK